jgi:hypothetical protein
MNPAGKFRVCAAAGQSPKNLPCAGGTDARQQMDKENVIMRRSGKMTVTAAVLAVFALTALGCQLPQTVDQVKVPEGFDFSTTQDITVKVSVADGTGAVAPGAEVIVAGTEDDIAGHNFITRGVTDARGEFEQLVRVPARFETLHIQTSPLGVASGTDASIVNNEVSVAFGPGS